MILNVHGDMLSDLEISHVAREGPVPWPDGPFGCWLGLLVSSRDRRRSRRCLCPESVTFSEAEVNLGSLEE